MMSLYTLLAALSCTVLWLIRPTFFALAGYYDYSTRDALWLAFLLRGIAYTLTPLSVLSIGMTAITGELLSLLTTITAPFAQAAGQLLWWIHVLSPTVPLSALLLWGIFSALKAHILGDEMWMYTITALSTAGLLLLCVVRLLTPPGAESWGMLSMLRPVYTPCGSSQLSVHASMISLGKDEPHIYVDGESIWAGSGFGKGTSRTINVYHQVDDEFTLKLMEDDDVSNADLIDDLHFVVTPELIARGEQAYIFATDSGSARYELRIQVS